MSRKIVIIPTFASSHFLKCWIPNMMEIIEPDLIIINEGIFPEGPENKGHIDSNFKSKYCYPKTNPENIVGFDWKESLDIFYEKVIEGFPQQSRIIGIEYQSSDVNECFIECMTYFGFEPEVGDIIFTLEPDAFVFEGDKEIIREEISKLKPGQGLKCLWRDFVGSQYYCESINEFQPKIRRFCYCFDNMENYKKAINGFMSQNYPLLDFTDKFWIRHYPWFVYDKWKEMRYDLIWRSDPKYWQDFEKGLVEIEKNSKYQINLENHIKKMEDPEYRELAQKDIMRHATIPRPPDKIIVIRPSRTDEGRYARFIDVEHPKHIKNHPNFIK